MSISLTVNTQYMYEKLKFGLPGQNNIIGLKMMVKNIFEILPCSNQVIFITKFVPLIKTPLFYEVNSFLIENGLRMEEF